MVLREDFDEVIEECRDLMLERNKKYGDSVNLLRYTTIIDLMAAKLYRLQRLDINDSKTLDELQDVINYAAFALLKKRGKLM